MRLRCIQLGIERLLTVATGVMLKLICELRFCPVIASPGKKQKSISKQTKDVRMYNILNDMQSLQEGFRITHRLQTMTSTMTEMRKTTPAAAEPMIRGSFSFRLESYSSTLTQWKEHTAWNIPNKFLLHKVNTFWSIGPTCLRSTLSWQSFLYSWVLAVNNITTHSL